MIDCVAYTPRDVRTATRIFTDVDAYVYVSTASVYADSMTAEMEIPMREGSTPLYECTEEQADSNSAESYGPRKAEGDHAVFAAAERGINAMSVRPTLVYGPYDYHERFDYWINRVHEYKSLIVPGDGGSILHRAYVEDVASAFRLVAEEGTPGEAYHASEHELGSVELSPSDFILYTPRPMIAETAKLATLGWESTPLDEALTRTVEDHLGSDRVGSKYDPGREAEKRLIDTLRPP